MARRSMSGRHGVRHSTGPRQMGGRRRAVGHDRVERPPPKRSTRAVRGPSRRCCSRTSSTPPPGSSGSATPAWAVLVGRPQRAPPRAAEHLPRRREVKTTGDGLLAVFDSPTRAAQCALEITRSVRAIGLEIRADLHTGEIELVGDDVRDRRPHGGADPRAGGPGEVLVSSSTAGLIEGSNLILEDAGLHELKGLFGTCQAFSSSSRAVRRDASLGAALAGAEAMERVLLALVQHCNAPARGPGSEQYDRSQRRPAATSSQAPQIASTLMIAHLRELRICG